jgi:hypothetical protein
MQAPEPKKLKNENHHWWPKAVSQHWANGEGTVHQVTNDGKDVASRPKNFGANRNDNNIQLGRTPTVWDESFEKAFDKADSEFPSVITWLKNAIAVKGATSGGLKERLSPLEMPEAIHAALAECLASLIVRSPRFRYCVRLTTDHYRGRMGFSQPAEQTLIGLNVRHCQTAFRKAMQRGKFCVMDAGRSEFIFGDGFLSNFSSSAGAPYSPMCLIPITPEIAVYYIKPIQYRTEPKAHRITLAPHEVTYLNNIVQTYAKRFLFYRSQKPTLTEHFLKGEHLQQPYDKDATLDEISIAMGEVRSPSYGFLESFLATKPK